MWQLADKKINNRLLLGTALYPSLSVMKESILAAKVEVVTISLKRELAGGSTNNHYFLDEIRKLKCHLLPNTAGCFTAKEAIVLAQIAREIFGTHWIKLEVIGDHDTLQPNPFELVYAAEALIADGFQVFPYCTEDLVLCKRLVEVGCNILMPWGSPIGSGQGLLNPYALSILRARFPDITLMVDAGIRTPSQAAEVLEMGFDGVLVNSAVALSADPAKMAKAFSQAVSAGRLAYEAGLMPKRHLAHSSTALIDTPFWVQ